MMTDDRSPRERANHRHRGERSSRELQTQGPTVISLCSTPPMGRSTRTETTAEADEPSTLRCIVAALKENFALLVAGSLAYSAFMSILPPHAGTGSRFRVRCPAVPRHRYAVHRTVHAREHAGTVRSVDAEHRGPRHRLAGEPPCWSPGARFACSERSTPPSRCFTTPLTRGSRQQDA